MLKLTQDILNRCKGLLYHADLLSEGEQPLLRVAVDELIPSTLLAKVLEEFGQTFPETDLEIFMGIMGDVGEMVKSGRVHVGIELPEGSPAAGCNWQLIGRMDFIAVTAKSHPLAKIRRITPDDLSHYRQLVAISRSGQMESESTLFGDRRWMCESSRVIRNLILQGQGWGIVAHHHVKRTFRTLKQ